LSIRPAQRADLPALGRLGAALMRAHYEFDPQRFLSPRHGSEEGYAAFLGSMLEDADSAIFVAEIDGDVAGYIYAALEPLSWKELRGPAGFIHDVAVDETYRRRGVASALMQAAVDWLRANNAPRVVLWTAAPNTAAQRLFARLGFRETMKEMTMELGG
jgi:ribosomal protein S18 acetylase RimI-like enzyme